MKTSSILLTAGFILLPWCFNAVFAQKQDNTGDKKITIIKRTVEADGSEVTETIVKKGKAAENFDVDKYVRENRDAKNQVEVIVNSDNDEVDAAAWSHGTGFAWPSCNDNSTFLGVEEDSDEDSAKPGLTVQITRGSAADKAGLRHNDVILQLNDTKTNEWSDLSNFINKAKAGDKVKVTYSRNGKTATTDAILTTRKEVKCIDASASKGFLGISDEDENDEEAGVAVSITKGSGAEKAGLQDGDVVFQLNDTPIADFEDVSDYMAYTKPGEKVLVTFEHEGQRKTAEVLLSEPMNTWNKESYTINGGDMKGLQNFRFDQDFPSKINCTVKEKEACLGVYSDDNQERGATVQSFTTESAAREAGMEEGDVILSVNGQEVNGHSQLWDQIAKYKTGDKVDVAYEHEGQSLQVKAMLKACRDNQSRVEIFDATENGPDNNRRFYTWNWGRDDQRHLRETRIIIIRRAGEGDGSKVNLSPNTTPSAENRSLALSSFKAYPNPSSGQVTVEFKGEPVATVVSLLDMSGKQLFREELNAFNGDYNQQFDLTAYAKGTIIIHVQQGDKVYTEQIIVN